MSQNILEKHRHLKRLLTWSNIIITARPVTKLRVSDHCILKIKTNTEICIEPRQEKLYRNYAHFESELFVNELRNYMQDKETEN